MTNHFRLRVIEHGPAGIDPDAVAALVAAAIIERRTEIAERILDGRGPGIGVYSVFLEQSRYYAVCNDATGRPITFLTQEQIRALKDAARGRAASVHRAIIAEDQRRAEREWKRRQARMAGGR